MKEVNSSDAQKAFTLLELLTIVALLAVLSGLALPIFAKTKTRSAASGCLSNLRQLQAGWAIYSEENNGVMMPNGVDTGAARTWCGGSESWAASSDNTNPANYNISIMAKYVSSNLTIYKCPADLVPSANGPRIRSYSMNGQMGNLYFGQTSTFNPGYRVCTNETDLVCPLPKDTFVFCDEHPGSIGSGYFQLDSSGFRYPDVPASYLDGGCGFSFADGHGEIHKWQGNFVVVPVTYGVSVGNVTSSPIDPDYLWLRSHSACHL